MRDEDEQQPPYKKITSNPRAALKHVTDLRSKIDSNVAAIKSDLQIPTKMYHPDTPRGRGATTDATRVAKPEAPIVHPSPAQVLKSNLSAAQTDSALSKIARGSRQVAANKAADEYRASRKK